LQLSQHRAAGSFLQHSQHQLFDAGDGKKKKKENSLLSWGRSRERNNDRDGSGSAIATAPGLRSPEKKWIKSLRERAFEKEDYYIKQQPHCTRQSWCAVRREWGWDKKMQRQFVHEAAALAPCLGSSTQLKHMALFQQGFQCPFSGVPFF
jgi:hypothetical protein